MDESTPPAGLPDSFQPLSSRPLGLLTAVFDGPAVTLGRTPYGLRKIVRVAGGSLVGPRIRARILPGGGDWALLRDDGVLTLDVRLTLETHDGVPIYMSYTGYRHAPAEVAERLARGEEVPSSRMYFRIAPRFEVADPRYDWLNRVLSIGIGERPPTGPRYHIHEIL